MIKSVNIINPSSNTFELPLRDPWSSGINIVNIDGLGPANADLYMTENAFYDGARYVASRLQKRTITFTVLFQDTPGVRTIQDCRRLSYSMFPIKQKIIMQFDMETDVLQIHGYVESNVPNIFSDQEGAVITVVCPDPNFIRVNSQSEYEIEFQKYTGLFTFPFWRNPEDNDLGKRIIFSERSRPIYNMVDNSLGVDNGVTINITFDSEIVPTNVTPFLHIRSLNNIEIPYSAATALSSEDTFRLTFGNKGSYWRTGVNYVACTVKGMRFAEVRTNGGSVEDYTVEAYNESNLDFKFPTGVFALYLDFIKSDGTEVSDNDYYRYLSAISIKIIMDNAVMGV